MYIKYVHRVRTSSSSGALGIAVKLKPKLIISCGLCVHFITFYKNLIKKVTRKFCVCCQTQNPDPL